jgi:hypothetical protein
MAKAAAGGGGGADSSVADQLRALGVKGVLVQMAERGQLLALKCEMPQLPPQGARRARSGHDAAHRVGALARPLPDP